MNHQPTQDQMMILSQLFPACSYNQIISQQGDQKKPRRRRNKKSKLGENSVAEMNKKRKLSEEQVNLLEKNFGSEHKLESERKEKIAMELGLDPRQVAVWFQNRRARWKNKKLEEEYSNLKKTNESIILEKCLLEAEVLKLREQFSEAEKEIQRLRKPIEIVPSNSSSTSSMSQSMEVVDPLFLGEFGVDGFEYDNDDVLFIPDETHYFHGWEWINVDV